MSAYFGDRRHNHGVFDYCPTPVGELCLHCDEPICDGDDGFVMPLVGHETKTEAIYHFECQLRLVMGSLGHQQKRCPCYDGDFEDPPSMSKREAALAAWDYMRGVRDA